MYPSTCFYFISKSFELSEVTDIPTPALYVILKEVSGFFHNDGYLRPAESKMHTSLFCRWPIQTFYFKLHFYAAVKVAGAVGQ